MGFGVGVAEDGYVPPPPPSSSTAFALLRPSLYLLYLRHRLSQLLRDHMHAAPT